MMSATTRPDNTTPELTPVGARVREFLAQPRGMLIDGKWCAAASGETLAIINPATGSTLTTVPRGSEADIDNAVRAALRALENPIWRDMTAMDRTKLMLKLADLIERDADDLAVLECLNNGKPASLTRWVEIEGSIKTFRYFAGWITKFGGETVPVSPRGGAKILNYSLKQPVGVCGLIVPWNYPMSMAAWKIAPAVAAGCTVILKPADSTPLTALRLGELALEAGFPAGVINIVTGLGDAGAALVNHDSVAKIAFTGSTATGKKIVQASVGNLKKISLELGGKSPHIICDDADLDAAAAAAANGIFFNSGQTCTAGSRLYVQDGCYNELVDRLVARARAIKVGNGLDPTVEMGPLINGSQLNRVTSYIASGQQQGATLAAGGERPGGLDASLSNGFFLSPTVFVDVHEDMRIVKEEIFGPVVTVSRWKTHDELLHMANDSEYGLGAGIWTSNLRTAHRLAERIEAGSVWINCFNLVDPATAFGGVKQSGWGREMGRYAMEMYSETKSVWVNIT